VAHVNVPRIQQDWSEGLIRLMSDFRTTFLGPLAGISLHKRGHEKSKSIRRPSRSEFEFIRCASSGTSPKNRQRTRHVSADRREPTA
jgi:hypothetical protein